MGNKNHLSFRTFKTQLYPIKKSQSKVFMTSKIKGSFILEVVTFEANLNCRKPMAAEEIMHKKYPKLGNVAQ